MDTKTLIGVIASVIGIIAFFPYFSGIIRAKTKPHVFSWLVWGTITVIAFAGQFVDGGGPGAWVTGITALGMFVIFLLALQREEKDTTISDWISLLGAGIALLLWFLTKEPLLSVVLVTLIDIFGYLPTFRKSFYKPHEETLTFYALGVLKYFVALFALETYTVVTWLYPGSIVLTSSIFVTMVLVRRKILSQDVV